MENTISRLPAFSTIAMLCLSVPIFVHYARTPGFEKLMGEPQSLHDLLTGVAAGKLERVYKDEFPIRNFATGTLNAISLGAFHEARKGILVGANDWYFTDEEFAWTRKTPGIVNDNLIFAEKAIAELKKRNIAVVIALLPEKTTIYGDELGRVKTPDGRQAYYQDIRKRLLATQAAVPDLQAMFMQDKAGHQLFLKSDTHWTVDGAKLTAGELAKSVPSGLGLKQQQYALTPQKPVEHFGDLYKFLELSIYKPWFNLPPDHLTPVRAAPVQNDLDSLLGDSNADAFQVALVGTSYSANETWSFIDELKAALSTDVINVAEEGEGPFVPMKKFIGGELPKQPSLKLVIWEMPLRYFGQEAKFEK